MRLTNEFVNHTINIMTIKTNRKMGMKEILNILSNLKRILRRAYLCLRKK